MQPNFSLVFFTTLAGMAQGLIFFIATLKLTSNALPNDFLGFLALPIGILLLGLSLIASFFISATLKGRGVPPICGERRGFRVK